jgi:hypothetical protein
MLQRIVCLGLSVIGLATPLAGYSATGEDKIPRAVAAALGAPDEFVLYSLEPGGLAAGREETEDDKAGKTFHGHKVLGKTEVKGAARKKLVKALERGVADHDGSVAACFIPHHGIRVKKDKQTIDLVVCFQCAQVYVYTDGKRGDSFLISTSPREAFNEVLKTARVPLSEKAK